MCIKGPGAAPSVLREGGAGEADLVLATTNMDEVNMLCALTSKRLGAKYTIARIRDVAYPADLASLQKDLSIDSVINPEYSPALEISRLLRFPGTDRLCCKYNTGHKNCRQNASSFVYHFYSIYHTLTPSFSFIYPPYQKPENPPC